MTCPGAIYLAAAAARRTELVAYRADLQALGYRVTSRWLDLDENAEGGMAPCERGALAETCLADIDASTLMVVFTEAPGSTYARGGRHVEYGYAVATDLPVIVVGPRENAFHCLDEVPAFDEWTQALAHLASQVDAIVERQELMAMARARVVHEAQAAADAHWDGDMTNDEGEVLDE